MYDINVNCPLTASTFAILWSKPALTTNLPQGLIDVDLIAAVRVSSQQTRELEGPERVTEPDPSNAAQTRLNA